MIRAASLAFLLAACPGLTVLACTLEDGGQMSVCADESAVTFALEPPEGPAVAIGNPIDAPGYTHRPGVSRTIWESAAFEDGDLTYEVVTSHDRPFTEDEDAEVRTIRRDTLMVSEFSDLVDELACLPDTVTGGVDLLWDHLAAQGLCWDSAGFVWLLCR